MSVLKKYYDLKQVVRYIQRFDKEYENNFNEEDRARFKARAIALYSKMINPKTVV